MNPFQRDYLSPFVQQSPAAHKKESPMVEITSPKQTKKAKLIAMLSKDKPANLKALSSALGWKPHTTSAAMTRLKQAGHNLISEKADGAASRTYRIDTAEGQPQTNPSGRAARSSEEVEEAPQQ